MNNAIVKLVNSIAYYQRYKGDMQLLGYFENEISEDVKLRNSVRRFIIVNRLMKSKRIGMREKIDLVYQTINYTRPEGIAFDARYQLEAIFTHCGVAIY